MHIMAIVIIPVAVSVHTVVSWDFAMAPVPMWHSTIFGPYFVAGAIFSGIAGLILAMAALRRFLHLEAYLHPVHFQNLGKLLLMMSLGAMPKDVFLKQLRRFAKEVLPTLQAHQIKRVPAAA